MKSIIKYLLFTPLIFISVMTPSVVFGKDINTEDLINLTKPSIVKIVTTVKGTIEIPNFIFDYNSFKIIDKSKNSKNISIPVDDTVYGTGFIISEDGVVVTNSHIVIGIMDDYYRELTDKYLQLASDQEQIAAESRYKTSADAYDAVFDIVYKAVKEKAIKNYNLDIKILKPHEAAKDFSELVNNGYKAEILYSNDSFYDDNKDVAILKINAEKLPNIPLSDNNASTTVTVGEKVYTFGYPSSAFFGGSDFLEPTFSQGNVSAIKDQNGINIYQTDTKVSEGSSGSPMIDGDGKVVGIITYISGDSAGGDNFGFAIPMSLVQEVLLANNIKISSGAYFDNYKKGLYFMAENRCKKAIAEFNKAGDVNADFSVEKYLKSKIDACNVIIDSGKSLDSFFDEMKIFWTGHYMVIWLWIMVIIIIIIMIITIRYFLKRIHKDEIIIEEIIEHEKEEHGHDILPKV
jgi:S1-C subfamily serine protease